MLRNKTSFGSRPTSPSTSAEFAAIAVAQIIFLAVGSAASPTHLRAQDAPPAPLVEAEANRLTLAESVARALERNPELASFAFDLRAAEARRAQAAGRTNPEVSVDVENVSGDLAGFSESELTLTVGQVLELGGKRGRRTHAAEAERTQRTTELTALRIAIASEVVRRFVTLAASERSVRLEEESFAIAEEVALSVARRVQAGALSPAEQARADLELEKAELGRRRAEQEVRISSQWLAATWGAADTSLSAVATGFDSVTALPSSDELVSRIVQSPEILRLRAEVASKRARVALERSERLPDLDLGAGVRRLENGTTTFVARASLPIPVFSKNAGNIAAAEAEAGRADSEVTRAIMARSVEIATERSNADLARERVQIFRTKIRPAAERAFREVKIGYENGRFSYLDLLDARRSLADARREELEAITLHHLAVAELEALLGVSLTSGLPLGEDSRP